MRLILELLVSVLILLIAGFAAAQEAPIDPLAALELDLQGFVHVADDGIARSYRPDGTVLDYAPLTNEQLVQLIPMYDDEAAQKHLKEVWKGVNGYDVVDMKQIFEPRADLLPLEFSHPDLWAAELAELTPIDLNPATEALEGRQQYCRGKRCTTSGACRYMGCHRCGYFDSMNPRWKICI